MACSALLLAGGLASRMGENKAFLQVGEKRMIESAIDVLRCVADEVLISSNQPELYADLGLPVVPDQIPQQGPLSGIHAGLRQASHEHVFVTACDMPFIHGGLAQYLLEQAMGYDVVVPRAGGRLQPLYAVYSKGCIAPIEYCLNQGIRKLGAFLDQVRVCCIDEDVIQRIVPDDRFFFNVNTPEELRQANIFADERKR